ncbi:hypothetical protein OPV22_023453 [Ensete ventricosum]|uniref:RING-type E3 ubiquitin transferase n=1 Tax=Ensete ventricosum TaxID=4639 RepID=A0AAV8QM88_ENSVE|nr:hypothetical protein OPV22_023453 [Ensete ventricosum]
MTDRTPAVVLRHTTAFLDEALSNPKLRHRIISSVRRTVSSASPASLRALSLLSHALDSPSAAASDAADKILLSVSGRNPLSALLLALAHALRGRASAAALALLDLFSLEPALSRHEVAPEVFEALFLPHLLPVLHWFADQRSRILTSTSLRFGCPPAANGEGDDDRSVEAAAAMSLLSRMSDGQAGRLKDLERGYEEVLDANCKVYAEYLKEVVEMGDGGRLVLAPPQLVLTRASPEERRSDEAIEVEEALAARAAIGSRDGRYNPIWEEADQSVEFFIRQNSRVQMNDTKAPPSYPQRVSPDVLIRLPSNHRTAEDNWVSTSGPSYSSDDNLDYSSSEIDFDIKERNTYTTSLQTNGIQFQRHAQDSAESLCYPSPQIDDSDNIVAYNKQTPPKEFVCPITSNLFDDPVTLETGQTYERRAIKEWLDHGNSTCPITRQKLQSSQLPKTNYVLKRLIGSWVEENPYATPNRLENSPPKNARDLSMSQSSPSSTSIIYQASVGGSASDLRLAISCLCTSEFIDESEKAVLQIEKLWRDTSSESDIIAMLAKPATVNGFIEILFKSVDLQVLRAAIFLLAELASKDKFVVQTLTRVDSDVKCMAALFKKGLVEAAVLIFLLSPQWESLVEMDMTDALLRVIEKNDDELKMCVNPKTASLLLLWQILREENSDSSMILHSIISDGIIERVILSMEADIVEERIAAVGILIKCIAEDGRCRKIIADKAQLKPVLQSFTIVNDFDRFEIVHFLFELVKLNRRLSNEQLLHVIKGGGAFSMMHSLLVYLQTSSMDRSPVIAGLLLQLDLLVEPRKMSIYREDAVDTLISCLRNADFPGTQLKAAETILALQGRFSSSGRPLARALLLKHAGIRKGYRALKEAEQTRSAPERSEFNLEEEKAAEEWERKIAFALVSHEFGLVFEALSDGLKSRNLELSSACLISATWLSHMLSILPDTGVRGAARVCLLKQYILILKSARHSDDKALSMLALRSFMHDEEGLLDLTLHIKDILKTLRELKKSSGLAYEMLKLLSDGQDSSIKDMWIYKELMQVDCSTNGEVLSIVRLKNRIISGHLDGTIKVWKGDESILHLVHETNEHSKAVTSLATSQSGEKLYSGSLDKTVRVWAVHDGWIHCTETFDTKDPVRNLSVADTFVCFAPQGAGVKVLSWKGASKILSPNKNVRSLALVQGKLYCGCNDSSIQEIDLATETSATVQSGKKKLLGKDNPIYAVQVHDGLLYSAGTFLDGATVKVWSTSNYSLVGSIQSSIEVRCMAMSRELIYLGSKTGILEIWSKDKLTAIGSLQIGTDCKVQCMDVDADGEILVLGTSDGRLQAWGLT